MKGQEGRDALLLKGGVCDGQAWALGVNLYLNMGLDGSAMYFTVFLVTK